jgi:hypothetical protein
MRLGLEEAEEAHRAAHAANEDAQRRQAEERATVRLKEKEEAIRRYRIADLQPEHCSFRAFRPSTGGERALLSVATAHDSAATVQSFFDVGMNEIVLLEEGSLGPSIRHGKRFHQRNRMLPRMARSGTCFGNSAFAERIRREGSSEVIRACR